MNIRFLTAALAVLTLSACVLSACTTAQPDGPLPTQAETTTAAAPKEDDTTAPDDEPETTIGKEIVTFPDATLPDIGEILSQLDTSIEQAVDFTKVTYAAIKEDTDRYTVMNQNNVPFTDGAGGFVSNSQRWRSIGLNQLIPSRSYTIEAELTVADASNPAYTHSGMVGFHCRTSGDLYIDSGIWFCFVNDQATITISKGFTHTIRDLPFMASDGIRFRAEESDGVAKIYANDILLFQVEISGDGVTALDAEGTEVGSCNTDRIYQPSGGNGYARIMSHFASTTFKSLKLSVDAQTYSPGENVYAFREGLPFGFEELAAHTADGGVTQRDGILFVDAAIIAKMFDFNCEANGDACTLTRPGVTVELTGDSESVKINGESYDFTTTYKKDGAIMVDVCRFASIFRFEHLYDEAGKTHYLLADKKLLTEEKKTMFDDRFDLYRDVVYNYDDVECDNVGVGAYEAVAPEDRLVGIAYSTWHQTTLSWGTKTWGTPLNGGYHSEDRDTIYRHGIQLAEAGVDFIYVDWSNNTGYDPSTMSFLNDFRTIEEATDLLFEIWSTIPNAPKICLFLGPGHNGIGDVQNGKHQKKADQVYRDYVEKYPDLYFNYEGKPLLLCYGATPTQYGEDPRRTWRDDRYTIRWVTGYVGQQSALYNNRTYASKYYWSWEERGTQTYSISGGKVEAITVSPATRPQGTEGSAGYIPASGRQNGATFKKQFQRAMNLGAGIAIITTWNEWHSGEHPSPEVSRDIEPSVEYGTFYYDLMREQIRKFKGKI